MSGGHYPSYNHLQSSQEFLGSRHRLPRIPPPGPPTVSLPHAHSSNTSWMNKQSYPSNYNDNAAFYSHSIPRNFTPVSRACFNEESSRWSNQSTENSSACSAAARAVNLPERTESRICGNLFSSDVQQESMDLSSGSHHTPALPMKSIQESKVPSLNGETLDQHVERSSSNNVNGAKSSELDSEKSTSTMKQEVFSVIAHNPIKSSSFQISPNTIENTDEKLLSSTIRKKETEKSIVSNDNVESALETLFQSDSKSSIVAVTSSVIVSAQSCKNSNLRAESVEKILKSPSPEKLDSELSPESMLEDLDMSSGVVEMKVASKAKRKIYSINLTSDFDAISPQETNSCDRSIESENESNSSDNKIKNLSDSSQFTKNITVFTEKLVECVKTVSSEIVETENDSRTELNTVCERTDNLQSHERMHSNVPTQNIEFEEKVDSENGLNKAQKDNIVKCENSDKQASESNSQKFGIQNKNKNDEITYVEVESELEKMFAGIEDNAGRDTDADPLNAVPSDSSNVDPNYVCPCPSSTNVNTHKFSENFPAPKTNKKKSSKKSKTNNSSLKSSKEAKGRQVASMKENSTDISARRVPVIHIEGSKENPINVQIINSIKVEEDELSDSKMAAKRKLGKNDRVTKRLAAGYILKNYDPAASDSSWVCIFCKLCPHNTGISGKPSGDLFGPYFIRHINEASAEIDSKRFSRRAEHFDQVKKKQKRSLSTDCNSAETSVVEPKSLEIWAHENCFVWAPGVHLIGSKIIGFEEAVWEAVQTICSHCGDTGASIGCRARHCKSVVHYGCALFTGWNLDLETFITTCNIHSVPGQ